MYGKEYNKRRHSTAFLFCCLSVLLTVTFPPPLSAKTVPQGQRRVNTGEFDRVLYKNVLFINSYHYGYEWSDGVLDAVYKRFVASDIDIRLHTLYLDSKRISDPAAWKKMFLHKLESYPPDYFDLIIASDDNAFNILLDAGHEYHRVPVVFCGVAEKDETIRQKCPRFFGVKDHIPFYENIRLGRKLFPTTENIAIITDNSETGISHRKIAEMAVSQIDLEDVNLIWLDGSKGLRTADLIARLKKLPENTFVIFSIWQVGGNNTHREMHKHYPLIIEASNAPMFTNTDLGLKKGFLGGYVSSSRQQGDLSAQLALKFLSGVSPENVGFFEADNECYFNWKQMRRWGIRKRELPENAVIFNRPMTIYRQYAIFFWLALGLIILLFVIFVIVLIYHFRYRNYEAFRTELTNETKLLAKRYHILFEHSDVAVVIFEMESGIIREVNKKACEMFRADRDKFIGFTLTGYIENYDSKKANFNILRFEPLEIELKKNDGTPFYAQVILNELYEGNKTLVYAILNDITIRKKQEEEILSSRAKLEETLLNSKNAYWEWDLENKILYKEDNFWLALDINPADLKEDPEDSDYYLDHIHHDDADAFKALINKAVRGETNTFFVEIRMVFFGKETWVEIRGAVAKRNEKGEGVLISGFMMNIDKRKKQEQELILAKEKAEESDRLKSAFISNISHEIRTPLNGIVGFSNLLGRENISPEEKRKYVAFINENNDQLLRLINDILEISKIEADVLPMHPEACDLWKLCKDIVIQESIDIKPTLHITLAHAEPVKVMVDKTKLTQIIKNLLSNAKKFTHEGEILLGYYLKNGMVEFYVQDSGIGIPEDKREMIFERFTQADPFSKGTGLGLAISKALVEKMGGSIRVESETGKGSTFYFTFEYQKTELKLEEIEPTAGNRLLSDREEKKRTILIAAKEESNFVLFNVVLSAKYDVIRVTRAEEVMSYIKKYHPDALIAETGIFENDNYSALKKLRIVNRDIPVIGVCANEPEDGGKELNKAGFDKYLSKPVNIRSLLEMLEVFFKKKDK
ncbi:MAG: ABC transporter substrate binding protein [Candidatus Marinimicrobia bacterium]|nr:ABC transporter substrate binding protein [Candidatus Neomarinimicrobiota bacterium]